MNELAQQLNISTKTLYNYFNILRSKGLILDHACNLKLRSVREFKVRKKKTILLINESYSIFDITCLLYCKLIELKGRHQAYAESVRRFGRGDRIDSVPCENPFHPSLSYRTIAKIIKSSEFKAYKVVQNLIELGVIRVVKQKPQIISENFTSLHVIEDFPGYRFNIGRTMYQQFGNRIDFMQYPIYLEKITIRQYKKQINKSL
jgi:DNA-binding transcriptional regulator YhcF (GntR family)